MSNFRSRKLLDSARLAPMCFGCMKHNDGTVVAAHSNQSRDGKGMSIKAHDYRVAMLCCYCHAELDQGSMMSREERIEFWESAHRRTVAWWFDNGVVVVA